MKRGVALLLALVFVFTLIPVSALAANGQVTLTGCSGSSTSVDSIPVGTATEVPANETVTLKKQDKSAEGKIFQGWQSDDVTVSSSDTFVMPAGDVAITANYGAPRLTFNSNSAATLSAIVDGASVSSGAEVKFNKTVRITAPEVAGAVFQDFTVTGTTAVTKDAETRTVTFEMPLANVTVKAVYAYTVQVKVGDTVLDSWNQVPGTESDAKTIDPDALWVTGVTASTGTVAGTLTDGKYDANFKYTMPEDNVGTVTLTVTGDPLYKITTDSSVTIADTSTSPKKKDNYIAAGDTVTLTATPPANASIIEWTSKPGSGVVSTTTKNNDTLTFPMPTGAVSTSPVYGYALNLTKATAVNKGTGAAINTGAVVAAGTEVTVTADSTIKKLGGWTITDVTLTDEQKKQNSVTFTMPAAATTATAAEETAYAITVAASGAGAATTGPTYTYGGTAKTSGSQYEKDVLTLNAPATITDAGKTYVFDQWGIGTSDEGTFADDRKKDTTFTVGAGSATLTAKYIAQVAFTVNYYETGKTTALATAKSYISKAGATEDLTAPAINGYTFAGWAVTGESAAVITGIDGLSASSVAATIVAPAAAVTGPFTVTATYDKAYLLTTKGLSTSKILINGTAASGTKVYVKPNDTVQLTADVIGARSWKNWTATGLPKNTATNSSSITFTMPAGAVSVTCNYGCNKLTQIESGAWLEVTYNGKIPSETNQRYYANQESIHADHFAVLYHPAGDAAGTTDFSYSDITVYLYYPGTNTQVNNYLTVNGTFDMEMIYWVDGVKVAITNQRFSKCVTVMTARAEIITMSAAPNDKEIYAGEDINMSGATVFLRSADKSAGNYHTIRNLKEGDYEVWPQWDGTTYRYKDGTDALKTDATGKNYVDIQLYYEDATQDNKVMEWLKPSNSYDKIIVKGTADADSVKLTPASTYVYNASTCADGDWTKTSPSKSFDTTAASAGKWVLTYGKTGTRTLTASFTVNGTASTDETYVAGWTNSDPSVATIKQDADNPLKYSITPVSSGETIISVKMNGSDETARFTVQVLNSPDENTTPVQTFELYPATIRLFVGSRVPLEPKNFFPSTASQVIGRWESVYADGTTAEYCVSVDGTGTVDVSHYTDKTVYIRAYPKFAATTGYYAQCELTVRREPVTNMTLSETAVTMFNKASRQLVATLMPTGATDKTVNWTSSDSTIVSVDANGIMTANKIGKATITATSVDTPTVKKTCTVTVVASKLATDLMLNRTSLSMGLSETTTLTAYITPSDATTQTVAWTSDNTAVATVDATGKVRSIATGIATITAAMNDGSGLTASCLVTVSKIISTAVTLSKQTLALIEGNSEQITATVFPTNVTTGGVKWTSSNVNVATVDSNGVITAIGPGAAIITATANDVSGKYADCVISVIANVPVTSLTLNMSSFSLLLNDTTVLKPTVQPANATYGAFTWSSSDSNVASVDKDGKVSGLKLGSAIITCTAGKKSVSITVTVANTLFANGTIVNCARRVNVRSKASGTSKAVGYAYLGDIYKVIGQSGRWYQIQYNASTTAYIWANYVNTTAGTRTYTSAGAISGTTGTTTGTTTPTTPTVSGKTLTIVNCANCVNVRAGAGTTFSWVGYANLGETYTYNQLTNGFYEIVFGDTTAYVSASFCRTNG